MIFPETHREKTLMAEQHQYDFYMPNQVSATHGAGNTPSGYLVNPNNRALTANAAGLLKGLDE